MGSMYTIIITSIERVILHYMQIIYLSADLEAVAEGLKYYYRHYSKEEDEPTSKDSNGNLLSNSKYYKCPNCGKIYHEDKILDFHCHMEKHSVCVVQTGKILM